MNLQQHSQNSFLPAHVALTLVQSKGRDLGTPDGGTLLYMEGGQPSMGT